MEPAEEVLAGGLGNEGRVVRVGDAVRRPLGPWAPAVHELLRHLERVGFEGAPRVLGIDGDNELLEFMPGDVAVPPFPPWSASDDLLVSVATLQRRYHRAVSGFVPDPDAIWGHGAAPAEFAGPLVCHNDLCLENVVVRDGRAAAFIDFDFVAPVDRVWDIAIALRHWAPMWDPRDLDANRAHLDPAARCRLFLDAHDARRRRARADDRRAACVPRPGSRLREGASRRGPHRSHRTVERRLRRQEPSLPPLGHEAPRPTDLTSLVSVRDRVALATRSSTERRPVERSRRAAAPWLRALRRS